MTIVDRLLASEEPAVRLKVRIGVLGEDPDSAVVLALQQEVKRSLLVRGLLGNRDDRGRVKPVRTPYKKWQGAHWVFATLADINYPPADSELLPIRNQVLDHWLNAVAFEEFECANASQAKRRKGVPIIDGLARRCASQQGNALYASMKLRFVDERCHKLARRLMGWQWPDGGWNCDINARGHTSSFWESLIPLRALGLYGRATGDRDARLATARAAEPFLTRSLFRRRKDGAVMHAEFLQLHYPCYWHYDILFALKVMAETGFIADSRCSDALDLLESKRLPDGGWPVEARYHRDSTQLGSNGDLVSWGGVNRKRMNEWVTADALTVLSASGRSP